MFRVLLSLIFLCSLLDGYSQSKYKIDSLPKEMNFLGKDTVYSFRKNRVYSTSINVIKSNENLTFKGGEVVFRKDELYYVNITKQWSSKDDSIKIYSKNDSIGMRISQGIPYFFLFFKGKEIKDKDTLSINTFRSSLSFKAVYSRGQEALEYYSPKPDASFSVDLIHLRGRQVISEWNVKTKDRLIMSNDKIKAFNDGDRLVIMYWIKYKNVSYSPVHCLKSIVIKR